MTRMTKSSSSSARANHSQCRSYGIGSVEKDAARVAGSLRHSQRARQSAIVAGRNLRTGSVSDIVAFADRRLRRNGGNRATTEHLVEANGVDTRLDAAGSQN